MLFNSGLFIFAFLPVFLLGFFILASIGWRHAPILWAFIASLAFYAWDDPLRLLPLILVSIAFNFMIGRGLARRRSSGLLILGLAGNLLYLCYFKYAFFLLGSFNVAAGLPAPDFHITLPIGISFYTFTQVAYLVDTYQGKVRDYEPHSYGLFVTYFPHLIAGPILHHKEIMPQFQREDTFRPRTDFIVIGLMWFTAGLFKKIVLADNIAVFVEPVFKAAAAGATVTLVDAWTGTLSYSLQIYFDFSGYSDMAIGLALMMGITFPLNFNSPYKATSLVDFWRRWHMTLSRFLRDYLYVPLGGNRHGTSRRYMNVTVTMLLGGLWHGASWNFVLWGAIHGLALVINHAWRDVAGRFGIVLPRGIGWLLTALIVLLAWVPFRADTFAASIAVWRGMLGFDGIGWSHGSSLGAAAMWIALLLAVALGAPNTQQLLPRRWNDVAHSWLSWRPRMLWATVMGCLFGSAVAASLTKASYFLYFRF
jgi:alginate O-acetyltransferase complex protein AlgI